GRTVDFRNTVLIMTSNIRSQDILEMGTHNWEQVETKVMDLLRRTFRPEFLNRVDDTIIFRPLSSDDIAKVVDIQIKRVERLVAAADREGMEVANEEARKAASSGDVPVGAVVFRDGAVVARAHNQTVARRDPTAHAELLVVQAALALLHTDRLTDCTLYVTLEPCAQCAGAIVLAKVGRVVFGADD